MATSQTIVVPQGATKTFRLTISDQDAVLVDLSGGTVYFAVNDEGNTATPIIEKDSGTITEIEILAQAGATLGQADIFLASSDTDAVEIDAYCYDVWFKPSSGAKFQVIPPSDFIVTARIVSVP